VVVAAEAAVVVAAEAAVVMAEAAVAVVTEARVRVPGRGCDVMQADCLRRRCRGGVGSWGGTEQHRASHRSCTHRASR